MSEKKLLELLEEPDLPPEERQVLLEFIADNHEAFSLDKGERGETDLVVIDTSESRPVKQPPRRMLLRSCPTVAGVAGMQRDRTFQLTMGKPSCSGP